MYGEIFGELSPSKQAAKRENGMTTELVEHFRLYGTRLLILDEAGTQSAEQLRGITGIADAARRTGVPLTILLVGMDELPKKLYTKAQVKRRVRGWEIFNDWPREDLEALVLAHSPVLSAIRETDTDVKAVLDLLLTHAKGCLSDVVESTVDLEERLAALDEPCPMPRVLRICKQMLRGEDERRPRFAA